MNQIEIARNILNNVSAEPLEKAHLLYGFSNTLLIDKSGKEIKEKLVVVLEKYQQEVSAQKVELETLKIKIGEDPGTLFKESQGWRIDGFEDKLGALPLLYPEEELKIGDTLTSSGYVTDKPFEDICKLKYEYNNKAKNLVDTLMEIELVKTILNSYPDNKMYKLTVKEASMLGF